MKNLAILSFVALTLILSCNNQAKKESGKTDETMSTSLTKEAALVRDYVKKDIVIAHRGCKYWAPEETEAAFRSARNMGADYLEFDIQMTKDSVLVAFHDNTLERTTNIAEVYPDRKDSGMNVFTLVELRSLDAGSWYNTEYPERSRKGFEGQKIITLEDVIMIAEGYRIKMHKGEPEKRLVDGAWTGQYNYESDPADNGNRPGIYIETKSPKPGVERLLAQELTRLGWNINENSKSIEVEDGKVGIADTKGRVILQSFSRKSIKKMEVYLPDVPKCLLLWYPKLEEDLETNLKDAISFGVENNAHIIGPSIAGGPNKYGELVAPWIAELYHDAGMLIHPYTFDTQEQLNEYKDRIDGVYTNRTDLALETYGRKSKISTPECLEELGY